MSKYIQQEYESRASQLMAVRNVEIVWGEVIHEILKSAIKLLMIHSGMEL